METTKKPTKTLEQDPICEIAGILKVQSAKFNFLSKEARHAMLENDQVLYKEIMINRAKALTNLPNILSKKLEKVSADIRQEITQIVTSIANLAKDALKNHNAIKLFSLAENISFEEGGKKNNYLEALATSLGNNGSWLLQLSGIASN